MIRRKNVPISILVAVATVCLHAPAEAKSEADVIVNLRPRKSRVFGVKNPPVPVGQVRAGTKITRIVDITNISVVPRGRKKKGKSAPTSAAAAVVEVQAKKTRGGLKASTVKRAQGGRVYDLRFREKFNERVARAYGSGRSRQIRWVNGRTFSKSRKITVIVALPKAMPAVTLQPGETTDLNLPGEVTIVEIRGKSKVAEVTVNDEVNSVKIAAGAKKGDVEFKLKYTLGEKDHVTRLRVKE